MEKNVNKILDMYYQDLIYDYQTSKEKSFLYRFFWSESVSKLLKSLFKKPPEEVEKLLSQRLFWLREEEISGLEHEEEKKHREYEKKIRNLLEKNMREHKEEWKGKVLIKPPKRTREQKKERRDFWEELMLNDAAYKARLITDTEYYLWLTKYLVARDKYYKDKSMKNGHTWLYRLLCKGLGRKLSESVKHDEIQKLDKKIEKLEIEIMEMKSSPEREGTPENLKKLEASLKRNEFKKREKILELKKIRKPKEKKEPKKPEMLPEKKENIRDKAGVGRDLLELAEKLRYEEETGNTEISNRLHDLQLNGNSGWDYLPWLTRNLEKMAIHIKIKNWLQDNGYPIVDEGRLKKQDKEKECDEAKQQLQESRKDDFSMRIFEAFCDSEKGYDFRRKRDCLGNDEDWVVKNGFCVWRPDGIENHLQTLLQILEQKRLEAQREKDKERWQSFYFPLAMDLHSGCVFFLAGKKYYDKAYKKSKDEKLQKKYEEESDFFCYDYLRLKKLTRENSDDAEVVFQLQPTFHENVRKGYKAVWGEFIRYCNGEESKLEPGLVKANDDEPRAGNENNIPRKKIMAYNQARPRDIPEVFNRFFDEPEDEEA